MKRNRESEKPIEYDLGRIDFYGCDIQVGPEALIPRVETEILVELILQRIPKNSAGVLVDMCTGTGCIGLAIKKHRPELQVILSDLSCDALSLAKINAGRNGLEVDIRQGDLFQTIQGEKIDYFVCNPPYIAINEYQFLQASVRDYEPKMALVGGEDGLLFYKRIEKEIQLFLNDAGQCFFEMGKDQGKDLLSIFNDASWKNREVIKDFSGHDRFFFIEKPTSKGI